MDQNHCAASRMPVVLLLISEFHSLLFSLKARLGAGLPALLIQGGDVIT
jgi:hypothetical protein